VKSKKLSLLLLVLLLVLIAVAFKFSSYWYSVEVISDIPSKQAVIANKVQLKAVLKEISFWDTKVGVPTGKAGDILWHRPWALKIVLAPYLDTNYNLYLKQNGERLSSIDASFDKWGRLTLKIWLSEDLLNNDSIDQIFSQRVISGLFALRNWGSVPIEQSLRNLQPWNDRILNKQELNLFDIK